MPDGGAYVTAGLPNEPTPAERVRVEDAGAYITAGIIPPQPNYARPSSSPIPAVASHSEDRKIALAVKAQKAAVAKAKKTKPTKAAVKRPAGIGVPSSPSGAPQTGTHSSAGVGAVGPAKVAPVLDPLVILGVGIGLFLVVVLLGRKGKRR